MFSGIWRKAKKKNMKKERKFGLKEFPRPLLGQIWRFYSMAGIRTENKIYEVGIYCRLSKDDGTENESASIATQKSILTDYVKKQGWHLAKT